MQEKAADVVIITPTPEPGLLALFGAGLLGVGGFVRRKQAAHQLAACPA
jgi:PEP-CTERM motif-containing protein